MPQKMPKRTFVNPFHDDFRLRPNPHCYPPEYPDFKGRGSVQETLPFTLWEGEDGVSLLKLGGGVREGTLEVEVNGVRYEEGEDYELLEGVEGGGAEVRFLAFALDGQDRVIVRGQPEA